MHVLLVSQQVLFCLERFPTDSARLYLFRMDSAKVRLELKARVTQFGTFAAGEKVPSVRLHVHVEGFYPAEYLVAFSAGDFVDRPAMVYSHVLKKPRLVNKDLTTVVTGHAANLAAELAVSA